MPKTSRYILLTTCLLLLLPATSVWAWNVGAVDMTGTPVAAQNGQTCIGTRAGGLGCTAKEFTVSATFSAAPNTPPICVNGSSFDFLVDLELSGSNADRYDITLYTGETGNSPQVSGSGLCSATAFPIALGLPWAQLDSGGANQCADYKKGGDSVIRVNKIKTLCQADANGYLSVPYLLAYEQNTSTATCTPGTLGPPATPGDASTYPIPTNSKCQTGLSSVNGSVSVFSGAYVDITKITEPAADLTTEFTFGAASGASGAFVMALTDSTAPGTPPATPPVMPADGTYTPTLASAASSSVGNIKLTNGKSARFYINASGTAKSMTITESPLTDWEIKSITCTNYTGAPTSLAGINVGAGTITASLSTAASAAICTVTNTKRAKMTLQKNVGGRVNAGDQFTISGSGTNLSGTTTATTSGSGTGISANTAVFQSSPNNQLTISESAAGTTNLANYYSTLICTNLHDGQSWATRNSDLPDGSLPATSYSFSPKPGDDITCTFTNLIRPSVTKAFGATSLASGGNTNMTVTIGNTNAVAITLTSTLTDTLPTGMTINTGGNSGTCGGVTATAGAGSFTMANGTSIPAGGCTIIVNVTSSTAGAATNTIAAGGLKTSAGNNASAASATVNIYAAPTLTKSFGAATIPVGGNTVLTLTMGNSAANPGAITTVQADDTFPAGLTLQNTTFTFAPAACGTVTRISGAASVTGDNNIRFAAAALAAGSSCQVQMNVTAATAGAATNTTAPPTAAGPVTSSGLAASANLTVLPVITLQKIWANALVNDSVNLTATGLTPLASVANSANETDTGTPQATAAGAVITLGESFTSGMATNYIAALACSGTDGLAGNTLTIGPADSAIICTYTNTYSPQPLLSVVKFASTGSAIPGQTVLYTIQVSNTGAGSGKDVLITDDLSLYTAFGITTYPSTGTPFDFTNSGSGLTFGTPEYYIPASGWSNSTPADEDGGFNNSVTRWRILMNGSIVPGGGFTLNYRTRVK